MIYFILFYQFFKIGLFSFGGAYATIPFLYDLSNRFGWFSHEDIVNMLAISQSIPGPIGINLASFSGFQAAGLIGGIIAPIGLITPAIIMISFISKFLNKFCDNPTVNAILWGLRPAACAMIAYAMFIIMKVALFNLPKFHLTGQIQDIFKVPAIVILIILVIVDKKCPLHPAWKIILAGTLGILIQL